MHAQTALNEYLVSFPKEAERLKGLLEFIDKHNDKEIISRTNYVGHITTSGIIISKKERKVLLLHNTTYGIDLQPGGHIEEQDSSFLDSAIRNVKSISNISVSEHIPYHFNDEIPIDIDTHFIPENYKTGEPSHYHHDFRYLFMVDNAQKDIIIEYDKGKYGGHFWRNISEMYRMSTFSKLVGKIKDIFTDEFKPRRFYRSLSKNVKPPTNCRSLVVSHILPDAPDYLLALNELTPLEILIPKPKSIDQTTLDQLSGRLPLVHATRDQIAETNIIFENIKSSDSRFIIFDIGGYFAKALGSLHSKLGDRLIGVIEDTENGIQKYESLEDIPVPVFSVARSSLKVHEDYLVGQSVLFSADALLRDIGKLIQYSSCSVMGYGKIGSSIAHHLLLRGVKPRLFDTNSIKRIEAYNRHCDIPERNFIIENSDVIFCATGNNCLNISDFRKLKDGCFIFSVTSSDDELDLNFLNAEYQDSKISDHITRFQNDKNTFYLANNGNAVNFIHNAVIGDFIHAVKGEMIFALNRFSTDSPKSGIQELSNEERLEVATKWIDYFVTNT